MIRPLRTWLFWLFLWVSAILHAVSANAQETPVEPETANEQETVEVTQDKLVVEVTDESISADDLEILLVPLTAKELSDVAGTWQGYVRSQLEDVAQTSRSLLSASGKQEDSLRSQLASQSESGSVLLNNYRIVLEAWTLKGANAEDLQPHTNYILALKAGALKTTDFQTLFQNAWAWLFSWEGGVGLLMAALGVLLAVWAMMFVARMVRRVTESGLEKIPTISRMLKRFIATAVFWAVFVLGILVVLALFGVNVTPLFAVLGGLSFILGFALQETLGNLASGLMIMVLKPFDTGDYIQVGGSSGFVDEMSVVSTKIRTFDNQIIIVPNSKIWGDVITNVSASEERRVDLVFGIAYSDNAAQAIDVLKELVSKHELCLKTPEPEVFVGELGDNSVNIFCRPWSKSDDYWTVYWDLTGQAKERFDAEGISIPFPQRDVHLIPVEGTKS
ncbi:mechanosensitive ion channel family protein [Ruegeria sp. AD91A]|uniref:mechanosensitive ion channel family protein n=1 Tax=Ruegeria sp. AD91A TaxID=2293862 RepID=UPI000E48B5F3|nr:mechanosensitive ion channel family protein [Ruegeria sp. AD91A]AXT27509.1 mechanosensitive ion channel family protein [Ruegeria sp. AD91A]